MSRAALLEQINVLRHQVFVVLNSHKSSLFLCGLVNCTDVRLLFQYAVGPGLRGCPPISLSECAKPIFDRVAREKLVSEILKMF